ncbi:MAG: hypothetical protein HN509_00015 [Halobacteriovoraceae bacterium]|nr:hypothetical protein [Halobacteriovoraceae bacterium]MBT5094594.1 hypothetical protein [Halobacteriovoraceae bacterium]
MKTFYGLLIFGLICTGPSAIAGNTFKGQIPEIKKELAAKDVKKCEYARKKICKKFKTLDACMKKRIPDFKPVCRNHFMKKIADEQNKECGQIIEQLCGGKNSGEDCLANQWAAVPSNCRPYLGGKMSANDSNLMGACGADISKNCKYNEKLAFKDREKADYQYFNCVRTKFSKFSKKCQSIMSAVPSEGKKEETSVQTIP